LFVLQRSSRGYASSIHMKKLDYIIARIKNVPVDLSRKALPLEHALLQAKDLRISKPKHGRLFSFVFLSFIFQ